MAKNIFDVINENINIVNENILDIIDRVSSMEREITTFSQMFKAPDKPNARGEEGVKEVSSGH